MRSVMRAVVAAIVPNRPDDSVTRQTRKNRRLNVRSNRPECARSRYARDLPGVFRTT